MAASVDGQRRLKREGRAYGREVREAAFPCRLRASTWRASGADSTVAEALPTHRCQPARCWSGGREDPATGVAKALASRCCARLRCDAVVGSEPAAMAQPRARER